MTDPRSIAAGWTDERTTKLRKLWLEGLSASQIAKRLGGVTRCAVIGKVHRLGLVVAGRAEASAPVIRRGPVHPKALVGSRSKSVPAQARHFKSAPEDARPPRQVVRRSDPNETGSLTLLELRRHHCKWPFGSEAPFTFCGAKPKGEGPYCERHARKAYQATPLKRLKAPHDASVIPTHKATRAA